MNRPKIAEFQSRLAGLILGHGTSKDAVESIMEKGLTEPYNYACVEQGWEMHAENHVNVQFRADAVADRTYPDPEGQWGSHNHTGYSLRTLVEELGSLDAALDELERCFNGEGWLEDFGSDPLDPTNYNLVVVGPVPPDAMIR
jgi:hypothetical protein